jgi:hypothetical protein
MAAKRVGEDWAERDLDTLLELAWAAIQESTRCHDADCPLAALVMLASAFEATLLGMVIAHEDGLRADNAWPPSPSRMHLSELARLAGQRGWMTEDSVGETVEVLNDARTMAAHPGPYVRGIRQMEDDYDLRAPEGYAASLDIVMRAAQQLSGAHAWATPGGEPAVLGVFRRAAVERRSQGS